MIIDDKAISYMEDLSFITLSGDEKSDISKDMQNIVNIFECISGLNTEGIAECVHPFEKVNVFRDDEVRPSLDRETLLKNAPFHSEEMFIAPKTVEG